MIREKLPITCALSGTVHSTGRTEPDRCTKALEDFLPPTFPRAGFLGEVDFAKYLILMVGAAGFEPTTCSTQNCRATRLRYTPKVKGSVFDTRLRRSQQDAAAVSLTSIEQTVLDPVAGSNAICLRGAANHLQHPLNDAPGRDGHGG